ncbi:MAG: TIGR02186 family protein [Defluviimonas sp.]|nr:TIGR02186 family protein [Defluviimonas sp.]
MIRALALLLLLAALPARAEEVVAGLSQNRIAITTSFSGSEILVFGAVKRDTPAPEGPLQVIITLQGPLVAATVWRKDRVAGIWVNADSVEVDKAPSFYAVATTAPLREVLSETEDLRHAVSIPRAIRAVGTGVEDAGVFTEALIRIRTGEGAYLLDEGGVEIAEETLFRARFVMPANLTEGGYRTRILLTRGGKVIDSHETMVDVRKVGLERWLFALSREQPLIYGLLSLVLAVVAGWAASAAFRYLRG